MTRTVIGFEIKVVGQAPAAAAYAGFDRNRMIWLCLLLSGGLAGLAGLFEVAGPIGQLIPILTPGYGFTAIIVAFLGRLHPLGIIASGLLDGAVLYRRRERPGRGRPAAGGDRRVPGPAAVLPAGDRFPDQVPRPLRSGAPGGRPSMSLDVDRPGPGHHHQRRDAAPLRRRSASSWSSARRAQPRRRGHDAGGRGHRLRRHRHHRQRRARHPRRARSPAR